MTVKFIDCIQFHKIRCSILSDGCLRYMAALQRHVQHATLVIFKLQALSSVNSVTFPVCGSFNLRPFSAFRTDSRLISLNCLLSHTSKSKVRGSGAISERCEQFMDENNCSLGPFISSRHLRSVFDGGPRQVRSPGSDAVCVLRVSVSHKPQRTLTQPLIEAFREHQRPSARSEHSSSCGVRSPGSLCQRLFLIIDVIRYQILILPELGIWSRPTKFTHWFAGFSRLTLQLPEHKEQSTSNAENALLRMLVQ